jgi:Icc-related predicted phosphoesterase
VRDDVSAEKRDFAVKDCFFVSDLHGRSDRYESLFTLIENERPPAVFFGGDLLPVGALAFSTAHAAFGFIAEESLPRMLRALHDRLTAGYPRMFLILGNDDARIHEPAFLELERQGLIEYLHNRKRPFGEYTVYGYACVPPTPFALKDWERYDVSRYVDPGCLSPEEGRYSVPVSERDAKYRTIKQDLEQLAGQDDLGKAVFLFHTPPYQTKLDRAALDGKVIEHAPLDVHVGSIAVKQFIQARQPLLTLHGHIHESARLTGSWNDRIGETLCVSAAHDGPELALIRFQLDDLENTRRDLR